MALYVTLNNGVPTASLSAASYDQDYSVTTTISPGTPVTLPASGTYNSTELLVLLNNVLLDPVNDYAYVGTVPRTQVSFTMTLVNGDTLRFKKVLS